MTGTCGEKIKWTLDENGTLTISGEGEMYSYTSNTDVPWYLNTLKIKRIVIENGITSIGGMAFAHCDIESLIIPDSVASIGSSAFSGCSNLKSITIPCSVQTIGSDPFDGCSKLSSIIVEKDNSSYIDIDGILFNKGKTTIICYPAGKADTKYTIPNFVTNIGDFAFIGCQNLETVIIPDSVTIIGANAFAECTCLESVTIPRSVGTIKRSAFYKCTSIRSITVLNPDCILNEYALMVYNSSENDIQYTGVLYGYSGSPAETYAINNNLTFCSLGDTDTNTTTTTSTTAATSTTTESTTSSTEPAVTTTVVPGDANEDGSIDLKDVVLMRRTLSGGWNTTVNEKNSDVNCDGSFDLKDVVYLRRYLSGGWGIVLMTPRAPETTPGYADEESDTTDGKSEEERYAELMTGDTAYVRTSAVHIE